MNAEMKTKLEKYMLSTGYYDTRAIRENEGHSAFSASFLDIFSDSDDIVEEKSDLLQAAEAYNKTKAEQEATPLTEMIEVETLNTQTSEYETEIVERSVTLSCDEELTKLVDPKAAKITQVTVQAESSFEIDGVKFRTYREHLWSDGGKYDDMILSDIPWIDDNTTETEIGITDHMINEAREHQAELAGVEELEAVMTATEIAAEFGITEIAVRQAIYRKTIPARQSGKTWLVRREDAVARWGKRAPLANMTFVSVANTNQETGEAIDAAHTTEYVNHDGNHKIVLTIIEGENEDFTPDHADVQQVLSEYGYPLTGWELG